MSDLRMSGRETEAGASPVRSKLPVYAGKNKVRITLGEGKVKCGLNILHAGEGGKLQKSIR